MLLCVLLRHRQDSPASSAPRWEREQESKRRPRPASCVACGRHAELLGPGGQPGGAGREDLPADSTSRFTEPSKGPDAASTPRWAQSGGHSSTAHEAIKNVSSGSREATEYRITEARLPPNALPQGQQRVSTPAQGLVHTTLDTPWGRTVASPTAHWNLSPSEPHGLSGSRQMLNAGYQEGETLRVPNP